MLTIQPKLLVKTNVSWKTKGAAVICWEFSFKILLLVNRVTLRQRNIKLAKFSREFKLVLKDFLKGQNLQFLAQL